MQPKEKSRQRWSLTEPAFQALLNHLNVDREKAGLLFESLREKLINFFAYEATAFPDRWADEALDRVAKRLSDQGTITDLNSYTRGVARMVLLEARAFERRERDLAHTLPPPVTEPDESTLAALENCLKSLTRETRDLIQAYYPLEPGSVSQARAKLAARLGLSAEALRSRALRIRKQLELCLKEKKSSTLSSFPTDKDRKEIF